jgi:uncharacterized protein (DUF1778 family)
MDNKFTEDGDHASVGPAGIGGRPRSYHPSGRMVRLNARFTEQERAEIEVAAAAIGMTATGFAAEAALMAARGMPMMLDATVAQRETFARLQRQLFEARTAVNRFGNLVNQAVAALHATGQPPIEALAHATALCTRAVRNLDLLIDELHRRLR